MSRQRIAILGPGAIGGVLAARLDKGGHEVTVIATERTAALITLAGLELRTPQETLATRPTARPWLTDAVDVLFVATKSTDLLTALTRTPPQPLTKRHDRPGAQRRGSPATAAREVSTVTGRRRDHQRRGDAPASRG